MISIAIPGGPTIDIPDKIAAAICAGSETAIEAVALAFEVSAEELEKWKDILPSACKAAFQAEGRIPPRPEQVGVPGWIWGLGGLAIGYLLGRG